MCINMNKILLILVSIGIFYYISEGFLFSADTKAKHIRTTDDGTYYVATDVEATLQEIANGAVNFTTTGQITTGRLFITSPNVPSSPTDTGTTGEISWDATYFYACVATNTWKRDAWEVWSGTDALLLETGDYILLETGDKILLE